VTQTLHTSQLIKNLGNISIAYKPTHMRTHTLETLEAREKTLVAISDMATHKPQHARGAKISI
jgi:hypothetical protein